MTDTNDTPADTDTTATTSDGDSPLDGRRIAVFISPRGTEDPEFSTPRQALVDAGATVTVISTESGTATTVNGDLDPGEEYDVDAAIGDVSADDFDAVLLPGGTVGADTLRADDAVVDFVKAIHAAGKPIAAICHAPWVLVEAGLVEGATLTSYPSLSTDITNAGGHWVDQEVSVNSGIITSRNPDDIPAFVDAIITEFGK